MSSEKSKQTLEEALEEVGYNEKIETKIMAVMKGLQKNIPLTQLATEIGMPVEKVEKIQQEVYG